MRVFLTGATGFLGSFLVPELINAGHHVVGLSRFDAGAETLGAALAGSDRPLIVTSGTGLVVRPSPSAPARETDAHATSDQYPRAATEEAADALIAKGGRVMVMRLPQVHDTRRQGRITWHIQTARQKGRVAFVGAGDNRLAAVHVSDAVRLFRWAIERGEAGAHYHAVGEEGVAMRAIAEAIGAGLKLPVESITPEEAQEYFGPAGPGNPGLRDNGTCQRAKRVRARRKPVGSTIAAPATLEEWMIGNIVATLTVHEVSGEAPCGPPSLLIHWVAGLGPWAPAFPDQTRRVLRIPDPVGWIVAVDHGQLRSCRDLGGDDADLLVKGLLDSGVVGAGPRFRMESHSGGGATYVHFGGALEGAPFELSYGGHAMLSVRGPGFGRWLSFAITLCQAADVPLVRPDGIDGPPGWLAGSDG